MNMHSSRRATARYCRSLRQPIGRLGDERGVRELVAVFYVCNGLRMRRSCGTYEEVMRSRCSLEPSGLCASAYALRTFYDSYRERAGSCGCGLRLRLRLR